MKKQLHGAQSDQKKSAQKTSEESQSRSLGKMQFDARKEKNKKKAVVGVVRRPGSSEKTEKNGKRNCRENCEGVQTDPEETRAVQETRIEYFKKKGD